MSALADERLYVRELGDAWPKSSTKKKSEHDRSRLVRSSPFGTKPLCLLLSFAVLSLIFVLLLAVFRLRCPRHLQHMAPQL